MDSFLGVFRQSFCFDMNVSVFVSGLLIAHTTNVGRVACAKRTNAFEEAMIRVKV